jgi:hypothetical protein
MSENLKIIVAAIVVMFQPECRKLESNSFSGRREDDPRAVAIVRVAGGKPGRLDAAVSLAKQTLFTINKLASLNFENLCGYSVSRQ